jgi:hypothetical protein
MRIDDIHSLSRKKGSECAITGNGFALNGNRTGGQTSL